MGRMRKVGNDNDEKLPFGNPDESNLKTASETFEKHVRSLHFLVPVDKAKTVLSLACGYVFAGVPVETYKSKGDYILPEIFDIKIIKDDNGNDVGVKITFVDLTSEKSIVSDGDDFSIERGIEICLMKRVLSYALEKTIGKEKAKGTGAALYSKLVKYGLKFYADQEKSKLEMQKAKEEADRIEANHLEKKKMKAERRKAKRFEKEIEIRKEAIVRAFRELGVTVDALTVKDVSEVSTQK